VRMDGAWIGSIDISIKKAFTARVRYCHERPRDTVPVGRPVLRDSCVQ
jgi:uncharacterized protein GlcG (DUF336 family)